MEQHPSTIEVTVDKSHIVTIGERLYGESIELIRELVNNAYDADATEVKVTIKEDTIVIADDGLGMDIEGLRQYFNIGSTFKKNNPKSPKFGRDRIGEFGIGKFATLSASSRFEVWTKRGDFQARVIFDKEEWNKAGGKWHIPLEIETADTSLKDGTRITLKGVNKKFDLTDIERRLIETVPIKAAHFAVYLNGHKINARYVPGHKIPFMEGTDYGIVYGEIIICAQGQQEVSESGIECKVKQVTVIKSFFGLENCVKDISRIKGEVNADFLPITSDRAGFIKDTPQYQKFIEVMSRVVERAKPIVEEISDQKENRRSRKTLTEVLDRIKNALILNPDFCPEGLIPLADAVSDIGHPGYVTNSEGKTKTEKEIRETVTAIKEKKRRRKKPVVKRLTPTAVVKRLKLGQQGASCCIDHFGSDGPECFTEGTVIYINRDHPLYQKEEKKKDTHILNIARLLTQEICLMKDPRNPRHAFQRQSKLLRDSLIERDKTFSVKNEAEANV